ncbi:MAG TPA: hypothetical protein VJ124_00155 [Pyrinomonadaceae bacterium]|nr:hypothetical protein [Pyrinomonadaceae bacterium]
MKTTFFAAVLTLSCALATPAQQAETQSTASGSNQTSAVTRPADSISIESGTRLAAELQKSIDTRNARVGDQVVLKTTESLKSEGRTIVNKGARLIGHITEIERKTAKSPASRLSMVFDRLQNGPLTVPITASIVSLTHARANSQASGEDLFQANASSSSSTMQRTSASRPPGGGLLGGAAGTVGGVVGTTSSSVGNVVGGTVATAGSGLNSTAEGLGGAPSGLGHTLNRIQISESSSTSAGGESTLSLQGKNLRLEQGTRFNLVISQSGSAAASKEP